ncbi:hypothetical protein Hanom_Chr06g00559681 [Helianthus anomalus]
MTRILQSSSNAGGEMTSIGRESPHETKIRDFGRKVFVKKNVAALNVPMNDFYMTPTMKIC